MTGCFLKSGRLYDLSSEAINEWNASEETPKIIYHLTSDGVIREETAITDLSGGEGLIAIAGILETEPLAIQIDFLKSDDGTEWLKYLLLRHIDRAKALDSELKVITLMAGETTLFAE